MEKVIVADASCLIVLEKIGELGLLKEVFTSIAITKEVSQEFGLPLPDWIEVVEVSDKSRIAMLSLLLDKGEASSIALCLERTNPLLIVDEKKGRAIAKDLGLRIIGTLGVLMEAKRMGVVSDLRGLVEKLIDTDFRVSPALLQAILKGAGE